MEVERQRIWLVISWMYFVQSWSGGKDSTASIILAHEHKEPLDEIIFVEVMYDLARNISGENPQHIEFVHRAKTIFESWGYKVTILRANSDYLTCFNRVINKPRKYMEHKGKKFGFPATGGRCYAKRELKLKPMKEYLSSIDDVVQYVGIAYDEGKRLDSLRNTGGISLLEKYRCSEKEAMELCKRHNLLSPTYSLSKRGGCWFCPNAKMQEHKEIRATMPEVWEEFMALEKEDVAFPYWNIYTKESIHERNEKIMYEEAQMNIFDFLK